MSQKTGLIIAAALTAFVLVVGGAVAGNVSQLGNVLAKSSELFASNSTEGSENVSAQTQPPKLAQALMEREAAYQELIDQANERLQEAYSQNQAQASISTTGMTADQAAGIALESYPNGLVVNTPKLVSFQGITAFEVQLLNGTVYISTATGEILYSTITSSPASPPMYYGSGGGNGSRPSNFNSSNSSEGGEELDDDGEDDEDHDEDGPEEEHEEEHEVEHEDEPEIENTGG